jgi:hypothetical protein
MWVVGLDRLAVNVKDVDTSVESPYLSRVGGSPLEEMPL